jgi:hypothetical protein
MRRCRSILIAVFVLFNGAALAAHPGAASAGAHGPLAVPERPPGGPGGPGAAVQPGGPTGGQRAAVGAQKVVTSTNWAGYGSAGAAGRYTSVASDWVQPAGRCSPGNQYAAFWVGLDGYASSTVEQVGSEADCIGGTARYSAWYELYPAGPVYFGAMVRPGDRLHGSVSYSGGRFLLALTDSTQGWTRSVSQSVPGAARSSAEVIVEAPCCTASGGALPLTNFGSVSFSAATVNGTGICNSNPAEIVMAGVAVSPLLGCGYFTVGVTAGSWPVFSGAGNPGRSG